MNTYPNEKKEGGDFWHELEKAWELVLQKEERRRGSLTGSTRNTYQFLPRKLVGKSIPTFSKSQHLRYSVRQKIFGVTPHRHITIILSSLIFIKHHTYPTLSISPSHSCSLFLFSAHRHFICREHHDRHLGLGEEEGEEEGERG